MLAALSDLSKYPQFADDGKRLHDVLAHEREEESVKAIVTDTLKRAWFSSNTITAQRRVSADRKPVTLSVVSRTELTELAQVLYEWRLWCV